MSATTDSKKKQYRTKAVVIGAGVSGLTTALLMQCNGYDVTIVAADWPDRAKSPDYASPVAGAHWRTMAQEGDLAGQEIDTVTYKTLCELAQDPESGVNVREAKDYYDYDPRDLNHGRLPWWSEVVDDFKVIEGSQEFPHAYAYRTPIVTPRVYLNFLLNQFKAAGGNLVRHPRKLAHIYEALEHFRPQHSHTIQVVVNCTGLGAKTLGGVQDLAMFPTKGQTVVVRASWIRETVTWLSQDGSIMYIIPRANGDVVLGGSHQPNQNGEQPSGTKTTHILKTMMSRYPKVLTPGTSASYAANPDTLSKFDIVDQRVGFRPSRIGGPRMEAHHSVVNQGGRTRRVVLASNYGHGGAGYQTSWGCAHQVLEKIGQAVEEARNVESQVLEVAML